MANFGQLFEAEVAILDGGLGTLLQDTCREDISQTPTWSARPIVIEPEAIIQAHLAFLRAGARVILTSTYQCSFRTLELDGVSKAEAKRIMYESITLARKARSRFMEEKKDVSRNYVRIALSLGSFGACVSPAQEFDGFYPPPYGPKAYSRSDNVNAFEDNEREATESSIEALAQFHLERLLVFAEDKETWDALDCIAFETVPLVREIKAIRRAMHRFGEILTTKTIASKPWWVACVFPEGQFPERRRPRGPKFNVADVVTAAYSKGVRAGPVPSGFGINCTRLNFFPRLVTEMGNTVEELTTEEERPWLVVYPNGGDVYDPLTRTWHAGEGTQKKGVSWAEELGKIVKGLDHSSAWSGILAGGCCRTGTKEIEALAQAVKTSSRIIRATSKKSTP